MAGQSKPEQEGALTRAVRAYSALLQTRPVVTKAITSACISAVANIISQLIKGQGKVSGIQWRSVGAFAGTGLIFTGPIIHYFYVWLDKLVPRRQRFAMVTRIILDRFIFAPPFLVIYFLLLAKLEGQNMEAARANIREIFWPTLKMNWKMWTPLQYININYIPQKFRVLFASVVSLIWTIYIATQRR